MRHGQGIGPTRPNFPCSLRNPSLDSTPRRDSLPRIGTARRLKLPPRTPRERASCKCMPTLPAREGNERRQVRRTQSSPLLGAMRQESRSCVQYSNASIRLDTPRLVRFDSTNA